MTFYTVFEETSLYFVKPFSAADFKYYFFFVARFSSTKIYIQLKFGIELKLIWYKIISLTFQNSFSYLQKPIVEIEFPCCSSSYQNSLKSNKKMWSKFLDFHTFPLTHSIRNFTFIVFENKVFLSIPQTLLISNYWIPLSLTTFNMIIQKKIRSSSKFHHRP